MSLWNCSQLMQSIKELIYIYWRPETRNAITVGQFVKIWQFLPQEASNHFFVYYYYYSKPPTIFCSILLFQEASNYAGTSSCTYNQAKGIFFLVRHTKSFYDFLNLEQHKYYTWIYMYNAHILFKDSIVTTKTCSECYPELAGQYLINFVTLHRF